MRTLVQYLMTLLALFGFTAARAQGVWDGPGEVVPVWQDDTAWEPPIDPDSAHPADTYEPAEAATDGVLYDRSDWVGANNERTQVGTSDAAKFRTECAPSFTKRADPLLYPGEYPIGHAHTFFGPLDPYVIENVQDWDYAMGRAHPKSSCQGGPLNTTLYWEPSVHKEVNGLVLTILPRNATFYYNHLPEEADTTTRLRRNIRFIGGANPSNYNDDARRAVYTAAGLYYAGSPDTPAGFGGISCHTAAAPNTNVPVLSAHSMKGRSGIATLNTARYLVGPEGEDPWDGACTAGTIIVYVNAPTCWDGTNLGAPDGRGNFWYSTSDPQSAVPAGQCPDNYVKVMRFETKIFFEHNGWDEDLQYWYMSSDRMRMPTAECPDETAPCDGTGLNTTVSKSPCRSTGLDFCPFETAHFDWWGSWDYEEMVKWELNCGGLTIDGVSGTYADCSNGATDTNRTLVDTIASPDPTLSSDPTNSYDGPTASDSAEGQRFFPIRVEDEIQGALELDVHTH